MLSVKFHKVIKHHLQFRISVNLYITVSVMAKYNRIIKRKVFTRVMGYFSDIKLSEISS